MHWSYVFLALTHRNRCSISPAVIDEIVNDGVEAEDDEDGDEDVVDGTDVTDL